MERKPLEFFITKLVCSCDNEIEVNKWFSEFEWIHVYCDKCGLDEAYNVEFVYSFGK